MCTGTFFYQTAQCRKMRYVDQSKACVQCQHSIQFCHDVITEGHYYIAHFFTIKINMMYIHISVVSCCVDNYIKT
jgi:hypothetical protein